MASLSKRVSRLVAPRGRPARGSPGTKGLPEPVALEPAFLRERHQPRSVALCLRGGWRFACHAVRPRSLLLLLVMVAEQVGHEDSHRNQLARHKDVHLRNRLACFDEVA